MNIVFNNLLKISIDNLFIVNKHELKDVDKKKLNYIYRFSRTGCKFNDDNSLGLKNFKVRDKILEVLNSNRNIIDKTITSLLDKKFIINDNDDYIMYKMIIEALMIKLSKMNNYVIVDNELYVF